MKLVNWLFILALSVALPMATISFAKGGPALSPAAKSGKKLFDENCMMCHFANKTTNKIGPGLKGLFQRKELPYSHKTVNVANVEEQIEKGNPQGKPMPMPPFGSKFSKAQMNDLIAYLKTL
ncbi:MAG: cytochrome c [Acidobacteriota bacterium]